jgi:hypothetical protein
MNPSPLGVLLGDPSRWPQANTGQQYVDIGNADGLPAMSQQFDVRAPGVYTLSWSANTATRHQELSPYTVELLGPASQVLLSQTFDANGPLDEWTNHAFSVALSSGTHALSFRPVGVIQGLDTLIDSVDVRSAAVPTPSTLSLLLVSLVGLRLRRQETWSSVPPALQATGRIKPCPSSELTR